MKSGVPQSHLEVRTRPLQVENNIFGVQTSLLANHVKSDLVEDQMHYPSNPLFEKVNTLM